MTVEVCVIRKLLSTGASSPNAVQFIANNLIHIIH